MDRRPVRVQVLVLGVIVATFVSIAIGSVRGLYRHLEEVTVGMDLDYMARIVRSTLSAAPDSTPDQVLDEIRILIAASVFGGSDLIGGTPVDCWGNPYRLEWEFTAGEPRVTCRSAGPDRRWGTSDDLTSSPDATSR